MEAARAQESFLPVDNEVSPGGSCLGDNLERRARHTPEAVPKPGLQGAMSSKRPSNSTKLRKRSRCLLSISMPMSMGFGVSRRRLGTTKSHVQLRVAIVQGAKASVGRSRTAMPHRTIPSLHQSSSSSVLSGQSTAFTAVLLHFIQWPGNGAYPLPGGSDEPANALSLVVYGIHFRTTE